MSIKDIQTFKAIRRILINELKSGVKPDGHTLDYKLNKYFNENYPGYPIYNFIPAKSRKIMDLEDYNEMLNDIDDDLETLYLSLIEQNMEIINNFIYFEDERNKKVKEIYALSLATDELLKKSKNTNPYSNTITEGFNDFINIDTEETSAFVDLEHGNVSLFPHFNKIDQVSFKNSKIHILDVFPENIEHKEVTKIENCLNDYINSSWMHQINLPEKKEKNEKNKINEVGITFEIILDNPALVSQLELKSNTKDPTHTEIYFSKGEGWTKLKTEKTNLENKLQLDFPAREIKKIKVSLKKEVFEYQLEPILFSLKDISLYYNTYIKSGELVTDPYVIDIRDNKTIDKVSLFADEFLPGESDISYTIDIKEFGDKDFTYKDLPIIPNNRDSTKDEYVDLNNTSKKSIEFNNNSILRAKENDDYNVRFYKQNRIVSKKIIGDQSRLFKGISQWERQVFQYARNTRHDISIGDFVNKPVLEDKVNTDYVENLSNKITEHFDYSTGKDRYLLKYHHIDPESVKIFYYSESEPVELSSSKYNIKTYNYSVSDSSINVKYYIEFTEKIDEEKIYFAEYHTKYINYMFKTYIYCDDLQKFETVKFNTHENLELDLGKARSLYINNKSIMPIVDNDRKRYRYKGDLKKGWNKIVYVGYLNDTKEDLVNGNELFKIKKTNAAINTKSKNEIYCKSFRAQKEPMNYVSYYNLINTVLKEEENYFTINNDEILLNNGKLVNYRLDYFENINSADKIRIKAKLSSKSKFISPKINELKLDFFYKPEGVSL